MPIIPSNHKLYIIGDYHQHEELLTSELDRICESPGPASVIMLGDYDVHSANQLSDFQTMLSQYDIDCYLLRGNHDNPLYWQDRNITALFESERFKLLKDVDYIQWGSKRILTISGAVSVDRTGIRFDQRHCWPETEPIDPDAIKYVKTAVKTDGPFDILLSHTGPLTEITNEFTQRYASTDDDLLADLRQERKLITQLQIASGVSKHYFGHFHQSSTREEYGISMQCLNICETAEL